MSLNLKTDAGFKELLLKRISYAITCSVLSQLVILDCYVFVTNFSLSPSVWLREVFYRLASPGTWLYFILFAIIIVGQSIVCAKDYVFSSSHSSTRFQKVLVTFSPHNIALLLLHIMIGGLITWLFLTISGGDYENLYKVCKLNSWCLVEGKLAMVFGGMWSGAYFFLRGYPRHAKLSFPVIPQRKQLRFKASLFPLLKKSRDTAVWSTLYFMIFYYNFGTYLQNSFSEAIGLTASGEAVPIFSLSLYMYLFTVICFFHLNLMQFFFELFLTEHVIVNCNVLNTDSIPIVQHLTSLDFYSLSAPTASSEARRFLFALSQPGGHPHAWNELLQNAFKITSAFKESLDAATSAISGNSSEQKSPKPITMTINPPIPPLFQSPPGTKYGNIRNMSLRSPDQFTDLSFSQTIDAGSATFSSKTLLLVTEFRSRLRNIGILKYMFGNLPEMAVQQSLSNGQVVIWTVRGLTNLVVASLEEDPYGIVQKDLPLIITNLVQLKGCVEKLNMALSVNRKGAVLDEASIKMKSSVNSAVKRSLCDICVKFYKYLRDIPLSKETLKQLENCV